MIENLSSLRERRIGQFAQYLRQMHRRAHQEVHGSCFIVFAEEPSTSSDDGSLDESAVVPAELIDVAFGEDGVPTLSEAGESGEADDDDWRPYNGPTRIVQFSFEREWFCLDMPCCSLFRPEAAKILRERSGFFYLRDRPQFTLYEEDVEGHDPFRKVYLYGDEWTAAEDTAYVFFNVWKFPLDWTYYVTASAFGDGPEFENNQPML